MRLLTEAATKCLDRLLVNGFVYLWRETTSNQVHAFLGIYIWKFIFVYLKI